MSRQGRPIKFLTSLSASDSAIGDNNEVIHLIALEVFNMPCTKEMTLIRMVANEATIAAVLAFWNMGVNMNASVSMESPYRIMMIRTNRKLLSPNSLTANAMPILMRQPVGIEIIEQKQLLNAS